MNALTLTRPSLPAPALAGAPANAQDARELLCFRVGQEDYGLDILDVQEIRRFEAPTRLFGSAPHTLGVLDLRGSVVPVIDARLRLGTDATIDEATVTIVLRLDGRLVGLVVDRVADVQRVADSAIRPAPVLGTAAHPRGVKGLATLSEGEGSRLLILLDTRELLALDS